MALLAAASLDLHARESPAGYSIAGVEPDPPLLYLDERSGPVTISVRRSGDLHRPSAVDYRLTTISPWGSTTTATANADFLPTEGTLTFSPGDTNQTFSIMVFDDNQIEGDEDFFIMLDRATEDVPIQTPEVHVILRDNEHHSVRSDPDFRPSWRTPGYLLGGAFPTVQSQDGKILLITAATYLTGEDGTLLLRLLPDGSLDPGWHVPTILGYVPFLALQGDGHVLVAASDHADPQHRTNAVFLVQGTACHHLARFDTNGILDTSFSPDLPTNTRVSGLSVQRDGLILAAVQTNGTWDNVLFRLDAKGSRDPAFTPTAVSEGETVRLWTLPDGGILATGYDGIPIVPLNSDGSRDDIFKLLPGMEFRLRAVQPDGRILVLLRDEERYGPSSLVRLTVRGQLDPSFTPVPELTRWNPQVLPTRDGKIWVLSHAPGNWGAFPNWVLRRLHPDGSDDPTWPIAQFRGDHEALYPRRILELPDGSLIYATQAGLVNGQPRRGLARLLVNAPWPRFEVDPTTASVPESGGKVLIKLLRCGSNTEPIGVHWKTEGGTARPGIDYVPREGTLHFPTNESTASLELEVFDNTIPDEDRTVRLHLEGPPPERRAYPLVEVTLANDDVGFLPNGIHRFPNGRILLRPAPLYSPLAYCSGCSDPRWVYLTASDNLRDWSQPDLGDENTSFLGNPEVIDRTAPTNAMRFYRLQNSPPWLGNEAPAFGW